MPRRLCRFLADDHARLDALLQRAITSPGDIDRAAYAEFRAGLLKHISMEEKILLPAARRARGGKPLPLAARLRLDHSALATLLVPTPTTVIIATLRAILAAHNVIEEGPEGVYETCEHLVGAEADTLITELIDAQESMAWVEKHFHPKGLQCPKCGAAKREAREFREHKRGFVDYRCRSCQRTYNLYTGTVFAGSNLDPRRVVLLVRGVCKGDPATVLAEELALSRQCIHRWRKRLQANGYTRLSSGALSDMETETDEMFQNAGEKRRPTLRPVRSAAAPRQQTPLARNL